MCITKQFPDHGTVFTLDQGIVIGLSGAGFGKFNQQFLQ
jgi:hypothetical protein